mmetsp:Transcript_38534/g.114474  ORF Transcript_38534/g.114474 Transcript_38534/m.114474 type:complete len:261 (+) Transcript_38534:625-1407(+)
MLHHLASPHRRGRSLVRRRRQLQPGGATWRRGRRRGASLQGVALQGVAQGVAVPVRRCQGGRRRRGRRPLRRGPDGRLLAHQGAAPAASKGAAGGGRQGGSARERLARDAGADPPLAHPAAVSAREDPGAGSVPPRLRVRQPRAAVGRRAQALRAQVPWPGDARERQERAAPAGRSGGGQRHPPPLLRRRGLPRRQGWRRPLQRRLHVALLLPARLCAEPHHRRLGLLRLHLRGRIVRPAGRRPRAGSPTRLFIDSMGDV